MVSSRRRVVECGTSSLGTERRRGGVRKTRRRKERATHKTTILKQPQQIIVLPMHISTDLDGRFQLEKHGLGEEDLSGFDGEKVDFRRGQLDLFPWFVASDCRTTRKDEGGERGWDVKGEGRERKGKEGREGDGKKKSFQLELRRAREVEGEAHLPIDDR